MKNRKLKTIISLSAILGAALIFSFVFQAAHFIHAPSQNHSLQSETVNQQAPSYNAALDSVHRKIKQDYADVTHLGAHSFKTLDPQDVIVFDVREKDEFEISHIKNAIWIDPAMSAADFIKIHGEKISEKMAVFYCSVGVRSSHLAQDLITLIPPEQNNSRNTPKIYNLENGIFGWHNQDQALYKKTHLTPFIHPYNRIWKKGINRKELTRYK